MKTLKLPIAALAAAMLAGCAFGGTDDESPTAPPGPAATTAATNATPAPPKTREHVQEFGGYIDASAFLNALVESGCQIDEAEYKEVKRGGAIKVICSKSVDALNVDLDDL